MNDGGPRVVRAVRHEQVYDMSPAALENLERQTVGFLYALWGAMGVKKKIIRVESSNGYYEGLEVMEDG